MKPLITFPVTIALCLLMNKAMAQTNTFPKTGAAGIGTLSPSASSLLDITSTTKGILIPRMTKIQRDLIASPATGLLIYQTNSAPGFYYYGSNGWTAVKSKAYTAGTGITISGTTVTNTAPDQTVVLHKGNGITITGTYPSFTIGSTINGTQWTGSNSNIYYNSGNVGIGTSAPAYKLDVTGDINQSAGSVLKVGGGLAFKCDNSLDNIWAGGGGASNSTGYYNTAFGILAMSFNTTGIKNTAIGLQALVSNTGGSANTATGYSALGNNNDSYNTADGFYTLFRTTNSEFNTALGYTAGASYDNGYNNVFLGANTDVNGAGYYNVIAIGQGTICTAPSQVTMGNSATTSYRAYANWSNISDGRYKQNVKEDVPGLKFINKLRPVTYNINAEALDNFLHKDISLQNKITNGTKTVQDKALKEKQQVRYTGFVAQEVEKAANDIGYTFSGVDKAKNENDVYGLRYADFVVPLVKAVQELSAKTDAKDSTIKEQNKKIDALEKQNRNILQQINDLKALVLSIQQKGAACNPCSAVSANNAQTNTAAVTGGEAPEQNIPNPLLSGIVPPRRTMR